MSLKASNKVDTNRYELEVEVDAESFEKAVQSAYLKQNKKITLPGFRKGKAPRKFVEKYYGESVFYEEAVNDIYPFALDAAIDEAGLEVIEDKMDLDVVSVGKEGLTFKATVTTKPEVELMNYKGLEATREQVIVTADDIEQELKRVASRNSRVVPVEDRAVENGDIVEIDFEGFVDGVAFEGGKAENYTLNIGAGQFIPGFEEQIVGHSIDDEFDINVKFPEDYQAEELKGKEAVFKIKLHAIKKNELPEIDDEFVKDVSECDTLEEYKEQIKKDLTETKQKQSDNAVENQLIDKLLENMKAEIPEAMFTNKVNESVREFAYRLQSQGMDIDKYCQYTGTDVEGLKQNFRPQAEKQVKLRLALEKIAKLENIEPSEEDLNAEYDKLAEQYKMEADKIKGLIPAAELSKDIAVEKAMNLVKESANIK